MLVRCEIGKMLPLRPYFFCVCVCAVKKKIINGNVETLMVIEAIIKKTGNEVIRCFNLIYLFVNLVLVFC